MLIVCDRLGHLAHLLEDCAELAEMAVHAAMSGRTDMVVGSWGGQLTHVPLALATSGRKTVDLEGSLWLSVLEATGQPDLTAGQRQALLDAMRALDWPTLGSSRRSRSAMLDAVALAGPVVTPPVDASRSGPGPPGRPDFLAFAQIVAWAFGEKIKDFGATYDWDTCHDPKAAS